MTELEKLLDDYQDNFNLYTYGHYRDPKNFNVLQVGLVACFYVDKGYLPEKRQAIAEVLAIYDQIWGDKLQWGYQDDNPNRLHKYSDTTIERKVDYIAAVGPNDLSCYWSSSPDLDYVPDYMIHVFSVANWFEQLHRSVTYLQLYVPITVLVEYGVDKWVELIRLFSQKLQPMHGYAGLGLQHSHEFYDYQYIEYDIAQQFKGLDISNVESDIRYRDGFKSINWLTIIGDDLLNAKLGSIDKLKEQNKDEQVTFHSYSGGVMVQAGEVPALGYVPDDPYPVHYVAVNKFLKAARAPEIGSLGFGSVAGEVRFNNSTSVGWQARFDRPAVKEPVADDSEQILDLFKGKKRITVKVGELCQFSGLYSTNVDGAIHYQELTQGYMVQPYTVEETGQVLSDVIWTLLRRDDDGDVFH